MDSQAATVVKSQDTSVWRRIRHRAERALEVASILIMDAVVLVVSYTILRLINGLADDHDEIFKTAKAISHGSFLIIYLSWASLDIVSSLRRWSREDAQ